MNEKRRFIDRILRFIGIEEDELAATAEDDLQIPLQEYPLPSSSSSKAVVRRKQREEAEAPAVANDAEQQAFKVAVVQPQVFDDVQSIADRVKRLEPVVLSLEKTDWETARRVIDFMSGTIYTLGGNIERLNKNIFLLAPPGVEVEDRFHFPVKEEPE